MLDKFDKDENGQYYLGGAYDFYMNQKSQYPNEADMAKAHLKEALAGYPKELLANILL